MRLHDLGFGLVVIAFVAIGVVLLAFVLYLAVASLINAIRTRERDDIIGAIFLLVTMAIVAGLLLLALDPK